MSTPSGMRRLANWSTTTTLGTVVTAIVLSAVTTLLLVPLVDMGWHDELRAGVRLEALLIAHGYPVRGVRLYMLNVPAWTVALAFGGFVGRVFYRRILLAAIVSAAGFVLVPLLFTAITMGGANLYIYKTTGAWHLLQMDAITCILLITMSCLVARRQRRMSPGWCSMCGCTISGEQADRCDACGRLCIACRYDLTGNTSGVCSECGAAVPATVAVAIPK